MVLSRFISKLCCASACDTPEDRAFRPVCVGYMLTFFIGNGNLIVCGTGHLHEMKVGFPLIFCKKKLIKNCKKQFIFHFDSWILSRDIGFRKI